MRPFLLIIISLFTSSTSFANPATSVGEMYKVTTPDWVEIKGVEATSIARAITDFVFQNDISTTGSRTCRLQQGGTLEVLTTTQDSSEVTYSAPKNPLGGNTCEEYDTFQILNETLFSITTKVTIYHDNTGEYFTTSYSGNTALYDFTAAMQIPDDQKIDYYGAPINLPNIEFNSDQQTLTLHFDTSSNEYTNITDIFVSPCVKIEKGDKARRQFSSAVLFFLNDEGKVFTLDTTGSVSPTSRNFRSLNSFLTNNHVCKYM